MIARNNPQKAMKKYCRIMIGHIHGTLAGGSPALLMRAEQQNIEILQEITAFAIAEVKRQTFLRPLACLCNMSFISETQQYVKRLKVFSSREYMRRRSGQECCARENSID